MKITARIIALAIAALGLSLPTAAHASDPNDVLLAYAPVCVQAAGSPASATAKACRAHGWTVTRHVAVDPHHRLRWSNLAPCATGVRPCLAVGDLANARTTTGTWKDRRGHAHPVRLIVSRDAITPSIDTALDYWFGPGDWSACTFLTGPGVLGAVYHADSVVLCPGQPAHTLGDTFQP